MWLLFVCYNTVFDCNLINLCRLPIHLKCVSILLIYIYSLGKYIKREKKKIKSSSLWISTFKCEFNCTTYCLNEFVNF